MNKEIKSIYKEFRTNIIYNDDCMNLISGMIKSKIEVDAIITDPPYNISKKNNFNTIGRAGIDFGTWDRNFDQLSWLKKIDKILKPGGTIIIFNDWKNMGLIAHELENLGMEIKDLIRWIKPNPMPRNTSRRYVTDYEFAIWATKPGAKWTFNKDAAKPYIKPEYVFSPPAGKNRIHPTQKSGKMIEEIIKVHTNEGDIILDPFSGSGEISFCANKLNRSFIASEKSKIYWEKSTKRIKDSYIKPTFNHLGNKYRMMDELMRQFPKKDIDYYVDVFAGSGIVALNYKTPKKMFLNDNDQWLSKVLEFLINNDANIVINRVEQIIKKYKLPREKKIYKEEYNSLKISFNKNKSVDKLLVLILYGFNQQIRFNNSGDFNIPVGKYYWNSYHKNKLYEYILNTKNKNIVVRSEDFEDFTRNVLPDIEKEKTLFYFDPPYLISNATYNKNWTEKEEERLLALLSELSKKGYKWFFSNVIKSKNFENSLLIDFIKENDFEVSYLGNISYSNSNYQRAQNSPEDVEVLIKGFK
ncbi:MAG: DNA methyltransferase [Mycoplasmoidaceae bacterium]